MCFFSRSPRIIRSATALFVTVWVARYLGPERFGLLNYAQSLIAGLVGSFVGGTLANLIAGDGLDIAPSGLIGSFVGAVIVLLIWRLVDSRKS